MTDIREKVAKAICGSLDGNCECVSVNTEACSHVFDHADAALLACGYAEMRKALEALIECHGDPEAIAAARSILERTGEK